MTDPVLLTQALVRCPSVTPAEGGALQHLEGVLSEAGFVCTRVDRGGIANLFARWGPKGHARTFGFNGHTDVVPLGDEAAWTKPPFGAEIEGDWLYGRGATDMKSGVAAFVTAAIDFVCDTPPDGAVILAITGDEEGDADHGTVALLDYMGEAGEAMDICIVGEPTCRETMGDMMKIGRRGSMTAWFEVTGVQGHSAYVDRTVNPIHALVDLAGRVTADPLDAGTAQFAPSTLSFTTIDVGNPATNVIPARAKATCNIRFNDAHSGASLSAWLQGHVEAVKTAHDVGIGMRVKISGESFVTPPGPLSDMVAEAVRAEVQGAEPALSTTGGTSDARFVRAHCPVAEFGLVGHRMHQVDERVSVAEIGQLKRIYMRMLQRYFA